MNHTFRRFSLLLLAAMAIAGCTDPAGPGSDAAIASITVTGVPIAPLRADSTVQLVATPINSSGAVVSDIRVQWSSSDTAVATVSEGGLVTGVAAGRATITAQAGNAESTVALAVLVARGIGPDGGTVEAGRGAARLTVPQGVPDETIEVTLVAAHVAPVPERMVANTGWAVDFSDSLGLSSSPALSIRYESADVPQGLPEASLQLYQYSALNRAWTVVQGSTVDVSTRTVTGPVDLPGTYAVMSASVSRVVLSGEVVDGAIYLGRDTQLTAVTLTASGDTVRGYDVTWTTSDESVATVDDTGKVTGVAFGTTMIAATVGDESATVSISVIARPEASWSHTKDWTTYQGNNRRTGAIAATVDPSTFAVRWSTSLGLGTTAPATGGGHIYVTAGRQLKALNPASGAEVWSYDLGGQSSFNPPAFGNGHVYVAPGARENSSLFGVDATTGTLAFRSTYSSRWFQWHAPAVEDGHVYTGGGDDGGVYSFDGTSGEERWFFGTSQYYEWTPAVHEGRVYTYMEPKLQVVDAATGTELFSIEDDDFRRSGLSMAVAPTLGGRDNVLVTQGGRLISFDLPGKRIGWQVSGGFVGQVTVQDGVLFVRKHGGIEARDEVDGSLLWSWAPPEGSVGWTLIATRNVVFASTESRTYAIDIPSRRHTWSYPSSGHLAVTPDGLLLIVEPAGKITAINIR